MQSLEVGRGSVHVTSVDFSQQGHQDTYNRLILADKVADSISAFNEQNQRSVLKTFFFHFLS